MRKNLTHEIGSLAKPSWRTKPFLGKTLDDRDLCHAEDWAKKLDIESAELLGILAKRHDFSQKDKEIISRWATIYALLLLEKAGLDLVWDGEQQRVEMYEYPIQHLSGFVFKGHVRSFDNKYYRRAACVDEIVLNEPYHVKEYGIIQQFAKKRIKIPITGAYTLMDWSYDEYYSQHLLPGKSTIREDKRSARKQFAIDLARKVIYPNLVALCAQGVQYIQIDEPAATTKMDEIPLVIEALKESIGDLAGKVFFSLHICFSDYFRLFPYLNELEGFVNEIHFEFANRDTKELGCSPEQRVGYEVLREFTQNRFFVGLGVLDVHSDFIEPPELIRDRILYAAKILGDADRLMIAPDCGLRTRSWEVAFTKLRHMVKGRDLALG